MRVVVSLIDPNQKVDKMVLREDEVNMQQHPGAQNHAAAWLCSVRAYSRASA